jgi:hypothetical protein
MSRSRKHLPITGIASRRLIESAQDYNALSLPINIHKETEYWDGPKETKVWRPDWPKAYRK